jgi:hypothetical protein
MEIDGPFDSFVLVRFGRARVIARAFSIEMNALEALRLGDKLVFFDVRLDACKSSEILRVTLTDRGRMYRFQDTFDIFEG